MRIYTHNKIISSSSLKADYLPLFTIPNGRRKVWQSQSSLYKIFRNDLQTELGFKFDLKYKHKRELPHHFWQQLIRSDQRIKDGSVKIFRSKLKKNHIGW